MLVQQFLLCTLLGMTFGDDFDGMPSLGDVNIKHSDEFINSGISVDYVPTWSFKEGIRELIQNAVDGMTTFMLANGGLKSDLEVRIDDHMYHNINYRTYDFVWPAKGVTVGKFSYDPIKQELILENPGSMERYNILLGGSGSIKKQNKLGRTCTVCCNNN